MFNYSIDKLLKHSEITLLFSIFEKEEKEIRLVGGCVRDALLNREATDIDMAAKFQPNEIIEILKKNRIDFEDFAYQYGSVIAYTSNIKVQITSLREDVNQLGRHTNIIYTNDWRKDAIRRDFTINALYLSKNGIIYDYFGGQEDLKIKKLNFIGDTEERIQEDYLRIFRYFRFLGLFEESNIPNEYEKIFNEQVPLSFNYLSNDIVRQEILKMFSMPYPLNCFYHSHQKQLKFRWVEIVQEHFTKTNYDLGLNKCLNKIDNIIN